MVIKLLVPYSYVVTLRFQFPSWDEKDGIPFYVSATSKSDAIKRAKQQAEGDGIWPHAHKGRVTFTAVMDEI